MMAETGARVVPESWVRVLVCLSVSQTTVRFMALWCTGCIPTDIGHSYHELAKETRLVEYNTLVRDACSVEAASEKCQKTDAAVCESGSPAEFL